MNESNDNAENILLIDMGVGTIWNCSLVEEAGFHCIDLAQSKNCQEFYPLFWQLFFMKVELGHTHCEKFLDTIRLEKSLLLFLYKSELIFMRSGSFSWRWN